MIKRIENCPVCENTNPVTVTAMDRIKKQKYLKYSQDKYGGFLDDWLGLLELAINGCPRCGHHWYREQPDEKLLAEMYENGGALSSKILIPNRTASQKMIVEMQRLSKLINKPKPSLLDYGSGYGRWARAAVNVGFEVTAYEPSLNRGSEEHDTNFNLVHDVANLNSNTFDVINIEQVLEHVPDPVEFLKDLKKYCKPDTVVRITVPNVLRCPEGNKLWDEWPYNGKRAHTMAPFEHLQGFTPRSLNVTAMKAGFLPKNNLRIWMHYPLEMIRNVLGQYVPSLGQTLFIGQNIINE